MGWRKARPASYQFMFDGNKHRMESKAIPNLIKNARAVLQKKNTLVDLVSQGRSEYYRGLLKLSSRKRLMRKAVGTN